MSIAMIVMAVVPILYLGVGVGLCLYIGHVAPKPAAADAKGKSIPHTPSFPADVPTIIPNYWCCGFVLLMIVEGATMFISGLSS